MHAALAAKTVTVSTTTAPTVWAILGCIAAAGMVGGFFNAMAVKPGTFLHMPSFRKAHSGDLVQLGFLSNMLLGGFAAVISWGLYGPLKDAVLVGTNPGALPANLTVTALVGAAVAGAGGTRVVTNEIDKRILKTAAVTAAGANKSSSLATRMAAARRPADVLRLVDPDATKVDPALAEQANADDEG